MSMMLIVDTRLNQALLSLVPFQAGYTKTPSSFPIMQVPHSTSTNVTVRNFLALLRALGMARNGTDQELGWDPALTLDELSISSSSAPCQPLRLDLAATDCW